MNLSKESNETLKQAIRKIIAERNKKYVEMSKTVEISNIRIMPRSEEIYYDLCFYWQTSGSLPVKDRIVTFNEVSFAHISELNQKGKYENRKM